MFLEFYIMRFCLRRDLWKISWFILGISRKLQFSSFFALSYIFFIFFCNYICISLTNILHDLGEIVAYWGVATPCLLLYLQIIQIHLLQLSASVLFVVATVHHYPFWLLYSMFLMGLLMGDSMEKWTLRPKIFATDLIFIYIIPYAHL